MHPDVRTGESPPYNECMQSDSPLDTLISAADRALRSVFAPARASRPMPTPPPARNAATRQSTSAFDEPAAAAGIPHAPATDAPNAAETSAGATNASRTNA